MCTLAIEKNSDIEIVATIIENFYRQSKCSYVENFNTARVARQLNSNVQISYVIVGWSLMSRTHTHILLRGNENCEYMCKSSLVVRRLAGAMQGLVRAKTRRDHGRR